MSSPIRVLHVDDDGAFRSLTAKYLEREGIEVVTAEDAATTMATIDESIDCVLSDYDMPGSDGLELLEQLRDARVDLPFILVTGKGSEEIASEAIRAGVTDYLQKGGAKEQFELLANRIRRAVSEHRTDAALAESERKLTTLISTLPGIVYRCRNDPNWTVEYLGGDVESVTGYSAEAFRQGRPDWGEIIREDQRHTLWESVQEALAAHEPFEVTYAITDTGGETRWVREQGRGVFDDSTTNEPTALEGFITDVTDRRRRERELARQNERLDQFASVVSHDLRNPLSVARGRLELGLSTGEAGHFEAVEAAHERMDELICGLLELARYGDLASTPTSTDLERVANAAWRTVDTGTLDLETHGGAAVRADPDRLRQLFENLFRNAVEHADGATTISVSGLFDTGFFVEDDGVGIPAERRDDVLRSGYSGGGGTGFGLAIVETIAEAHGWRVDIGEGDDGGARFEFRVDPTIET